MILLLRILSLFCEGLVVGSAEHKIELRRDRPEVDTKCVGESEIANLRNQGLQHWAIGAAMYGCVAFRAKGNQVAVQRFKAGRGTPRNAVMRVQAGISSATALALKLVALQDTKPSLLPIRGGFHDRLQSFLRTVSIRHACSVFEYKGGFQAIPLQTATDRSSARYLPYRIAKTLVGTFGYSRTLPPRGEISLFVRGVA